ncbi:hypothetical protein NQ318_015130 [Aromia moschata]|uniref:RRM domain-containing protein n=1 Tax=Aromia moschata TaxID=1265417 RepID=A0AAV8YXU8_9CUCU|nr:hypothetical protein NQ318_015130 [Aromia moschata]
MSGSRNDCRIYVGNLPPDIRTKDIQDLFYKFGKVTFVDLKNRRRPPFAFVEFEDPRDADDAVHARDGYDYDGYRLRVEFPRGGGHGSFRGGRGGGDRAGAPGGRRRGGRSSGCSSQDLKDHMREAGDVCFADAFKDGSGVVEFLRYEGHEVRHQEAGRFQVQVARGRGDLHPGEGGQGRQRQALGRSVQEPLVLAAPQGLPTYSPVKRSYSRSRSRT